MNQVIMYDLLRHIQGDENLLSKPIRPATADYPQKARSTTARSRTQTHAEASGQGTSEGQTMSPEPDRQEVTFSDLTADGQKSFSMAWTFYQDDTKAYEKQNARKPMLASERNREALKTTDDEEISSFGRYLGVQVMTIQTMDKDVLTTARVSEGLKTF